tara:strand:+ start:131 stop:1795 length:1665 start_codon:yes stop_codon:yes gene_type:complete
VANKLQILSSGESFDLFDGEAERFYITYQIHDLSNLQTRNGDFSRRVSLPLTAKNKGILGAALPTISRFDSANVGTIPCDIMVNDMPALSDAYFVIDTQEENSVTIQIFGGISKFYSDLPDLPISALSFTAFDWDSTGIISKTNTTSNVVIPDAQWITNQSFQLVPSQLQITLTEMNEAGFFMYTYSILSKIFEGFTGLTFDTSEMDAQYSKYAIACAVPLLHNQYTNGQTITNSINPQDYFPDISQRDFVREIFKLQNIIAVEANNVVTLKYFKGLETATSQNLVLNTDKDKTIYNTFKTYSQTNELKYSDDDIVERTDADSSFPVNSETLPLSNTIIQSKFFPCDLANVLNRDRATVASWEIEAYKSAANFSPSSGTLNFTTNHPFEGNIGDIVNFAGNGFRRIVSLDGTKESGTVDRNFTSSSVAQIPPYYRYKSNGRNMQIVSVEDTQGSYNFAINGETTSSNSPSKRAKFIDAMKWSELKGEYYQLLVDTMAKPFIIKAWLNIPTISLLKLNPLAPVYVEDYNSYFYINKLEQWKLNTSCRVELIQIPI